MSRSHDQFKFLGSSDISGTSEVTVIKFYTRLDYHVLADG